jgi:hypothetical protein
VGEGAKGIPLTLSTLVLASMLQQGEGGSAEPSTTARQPS